jgi:hypothetical protein
MKPADHHSFSTFARLVDSKRRYTASLFALFLTIAAVGLADWLVQGRETERPADLIFGLLYGVLVSLLAALLISRVLIGQQLQQALSRGRLSLGILGVQPAETGDYHVAIVVPSFVAPLEGEIADRYFELQRETVRHHIVEETGLEPGEGLLKDFREIGKYALSRRDLLTLTDIVALLSGGGLPLPVIISDLEFMRAMARPEHERVGTKGVYVRAATDSPEPLVRITTAIAVGLWSNLLVNFLSDLKSVPFQLQGDRSIERAFASDRSITRYETWQGPSHDCDHGLLARLYFDDVVVSVVGGTYALGTARMGDLLIMRPASCQQLWNASATQEDIWTGVVCPGEGDRWGDYGVSFFESSPGLVRSFTPRLSDAVHARLRQVIETDDRKEESAPVDLRRHESAVSRQHLSPKAGRAD